MKIDKLYHGDCLEIMRTFPDDSVDMILCDPPYQTTDCEWDSIIPFEKLWPEYNRIIKKHHVIALFGNQPFTSKMICSNLKGFKYCWTWNKIIPSGFTYARFRPMQQTEDIAIFTSNGEKTIYYPQMIKRDKAITAGGNNVPAGVYRNTSIDTTQEYKKTYEDKFPTTLIEFDKIRRGSLHPTQKPIALLKYLINTYTEKGDIVLDNCAGSGSTCIAAADIGRRYIGIELNKQYFVVASKRIADFNAQIRMNI